MASKPPEECTICLEDLDHTTTIGLIKNCHHYYHDHCIIQWSNNSNSCPTCRKLFNSIDITRLDSESIIRSIPVQDKLLPNAAIDDIPTEFIIPANSQRISDLNHEIRNGVCSICSSSDYRTSLTRNMITCQSCNAVFHQNCLGISNVFDDDDMGSSWFCPICDFQQDLVLPPSSTRRRRIASIIHPNNSNRTQRVNAREGRNSSVIRNIVTNQLQRRQRRNEMELVESYGLDDDFDVEQQPEVYNFSDDDIELETPEDGAVNEYYIPPPVLNGGVIARNELRQRAALSEEELKSWDLFDKVKHGDSEIDINENHSTDSTRKRRRKRTAPVEAEIDNTTIVEGRSNTHSNTSKVLTLINQMRQNNQQQNANNIGTSLFQRDNQVKSSSASSLRTGSSTGGSPESVNSNFSPVTSSDEGSSRVPQLHSEKKNELTYDQKSRIQKFIRDKLRPLYKRKLTKDTKLIKCEDDYIKINKSASRKIYGNIAARAKDDNAILDNLFNHSDTELLLIVEEYVDNEINQYCK